MKTLIPIRKRGTSKIAAIMLIVAITAATAGAQQPKIKVTLLGTGCPPPVMNRFGPSTLIEAGDQKFLFDAGRGSAQRLSQLRIAWKDVNGVFLTHLHSDHVVGFPDLWLTGWILGQGRTEPLSVWGPLGTRSMMSHLKQAYADDIRFRLEYERVSPTGVQIVAKDIKEGIVYEKAGVRITAFEVDHAPVRPAFGYRIDYSGHSVVLSGDTRVSENLIRHSHGTDLLIHEVLVPETLKRLNVPPELAKRIVDFHTTPEQAGAVFERVKPKMALYSHICLPAATERELVSPTRTAYQGPLEIGEDLMVVEIGEKVQVRKADK